MGIDSEYRVSVSARFVGRAAVAELLVLDLLGRTLYEQRGNAPSSPAHVEWHHRQVFSGPARVPA